MKLSSAFCLPLLLVAACLSSCNKKNPAPATGEMAFDLEHVVDSRPLQLNNSQTAFDYETPAGEQFNVTTFRYYLSNIRLRRADGTEYAQPDSYYLVDEAKPATKHLALKDVPVGDYTGISFLVGVDAPRNTAGAQEGALAASDMFWGWTMGYIFLKMEGYSLRAPGNHGLLFHVGGFTAPNNALRTVAPELPTGSQLQIRADRSPSVHLTVNLMRLFTGPTTISFASFAMPHAPSANAVLVADNYAAGMFKVDQVTTK